MAQSFLDFFDSFFPVREESRDNRLAIWLDRLIYGCILLTALAAPISIAVTNIGWILGVFVWFLRFFVKPRPKIFRTPLDFAVIGFFAWLVFSSFFSYAPDLSFDRVKGFSHFLIAYLVAHNIRHLKSVKVLVGALILACMVTVVVTFSQRVVGRGVQVFEVSADGALARAGVLNGDTLLRINGARFYQPEELSAAVAQNEIVKLNFYRPDWHYDVELRRENLQTGATAEEKLGFRAWQHGRNWRSQAFFSHYTTYAEVLQLVAALAFGIFIALPVKRSKPGILLVFCLIGMSGALLLTATRASQIGFVLAILAITTIGANRKTLFSLIALLLPVAIIGAIYMQQSRKTGFADTADGSITWRQTVYREGFELLIKSPRHLAVGVGINSINRFRCEWGMFDNCRLPPGHLHSTPLQIAVDCGLPALFLWLLVVFRYGRTMLVSIRKTVENSFEKGLMLGALGGLVGFFASGIVHYNLGDAEVAMNFYLIMGLGLAVWLRHNQNLKLSNQ